MHCYRDIHITSHVLDERTIIGLVEAFAQLTSGWSFPKEKSKQYTALCGVPSCCVIHEHTALPKAALHLTLPNTKRKTNSVYVPNIIPLECSSLTKSEYNGISLQFARELRLWARQENISIQVTLSKPGLRLRDIIGGKVVWRLFQRYISFFPESSHPNDLARLDAFICAISRYSKRQFDLEAFELLLCEELGWSKAISLRCRTRVEIGLEVLAASRKFNPR
ncbi:hypothetical protein [Pseudomonas chlororaphis]|uniref:hypothetical protein n=1 Tax=Pseudomonas chlororaphis TaxID=587753 RepID=UPI00138A13CE|nr:hypothetical protein [Pseudomonas chlororaphis]